MGLINSKEKQFAGDNWGHPRKYVKRHTEIHDPLIPDVPRHIGRKKKKKNKKPYIWPSKVCPFCKKELRIVKKDSHFDFLDKHEEKCRHCGAIVDECPCCGRKAWRNPEGIYKHQDKMHSCGFEGKKKWN